MEREPNFNHIEDMFDRARERGTPIDNRKLVRHERRVFILRGVIILVCIYILINIFIKSFTYRTISSIASVLAIILLYHFSYEVYLIKFRGKLKAEVDKYMDL